MSRDTVLLSMLVFSRSNRWVFEGLQRGVTACQLNDRCISCCKPFAKCTSLSSSCAQDMAHNEMAFWPLDSIEASLAVAALSSAGYVRTACRTGAVADKIRTC